MAEPAEILDRCTNVLPGHGKRKSTAAQLREIADRLSGDEMSDVYGSGTYLENFEHEVAAMFGKEAAVFMPSGTMAQQIALRLWCERSNSFTVAMHPTAHLEFAEQLGYQFLHNIHRLQFGVPELMRDRLLAPADLEELGERPGALLLELPCRPLGGELHAWKDLEAMRDWASDRNVPMHLDGARIWQCRSFYGKSYAEIAELFDSLYVSFYKDLGGMCGCMLIGPNEFIKASRVWQRRSGGNLFTQAPFVASAKLAMDAVLPQIDGWCERAREVASIMTGFPQVRVNPDPPHVNFFKVFLEGDAEALMARHLDLAEQTGTWLFGGLARSGVPGIATTEIHIWQNGAAFDVAALAPFFEQLLA